MRVFIFSLLVVAVAITASAQEVVVVKVSPTEFEVRVVGEDPVFVRGATFRVGCSADSGWWWKRVWEIEVTCVGRAHAVSHFSVEPPLSTGSVTIAGTASRPNPIKIRVEVRKGLTVKTIECLRVEAVKAGSRLDDDKLPTKGLPAGRPPDGFLFPWGVPL